MRIRPRLPHIAFVVSLPVILTIILCLTMGCGNDETEAVVARRDIVAYTSIEGQVAAPAAADAAVLPPYAAPVEKVLVTVGQKVREGDVLVQLSAPSSEAYYQQARQRVRQAETALRTAQALYSNRLQRARRELEQARANERRVRASLRAAQTGATVTVTGADLEDAVARRQAAEQAVIDAEAIAEAGLIPYQRQLANAQQDLQDAQAGVKAASVRSPIAGTVLSVDVKAGDEVDPEDKKPLVRVVNLEALRVYAAVNDEEARNLKPGAPATITIERVPDQKFTGSLRNVYSKEAGFLRNVEHTAVLDFTNHEGLAKPGMDATARVRVGEARDVLAVPASAVKHEEDKHIVHVRSGGEWRPRAVEIGISNGRYTEIKSGLKEGDVVRVGS